MEDMLTAGTRVQSCLDSRTGLDEGRQGYQGYVGIYLQPEAMPENRGSDYDYATHGKGVLSSRQPRMRFYSNLRD
jgi:hypothetical protein